jgi:HK97 family phage prohead protease
MNAEERRRIERALERAAPSLREQLIIRSEAIRIARESLRLSGRDRERSLRAEARFLDLVRRHDAGEDIEFPQDMSWREAVTPVAGGAPDVTVALPAMHAFFGTFAPFNQPARIDNPIEGKFTEIIRPGALRDTIRERGHKVPLRLSHGVHPFVGRNPIGKILELREDPGGGYFEAKPLKGQIFREFVQPMIVEGLARTSFAFRPEGPNGAVWRRGPDGPICEVRRLFLGEITITDTPSYFNTLVSWRSRHEPAPPRPPLPRTATDRVHDFYVQERQRTMGKVRAYQRKQTIENIRRERNRTR